MTTREDEMVALIEELRELKKGWVTSRSFSEFIDRVIDHLTTLSSERDLLVERVKVLEGELYVISELDGPNKVETVRQIHARASAALTGVTGG